ncbi:MAG: hypothetical protein J5786_01765, partial [Clostridiales bacterium]|nr:hypothetical protein [Clostridiales bacterium]
MKRRSLLVLPLVMFSMAAYTNAVSANISGNYEYDVLSEADKTCVITSYNGDSTAKTIAVPSTIDGYTVTKLQEE